MQFEKKDMSKFDRKTLISMIRNSGLRYRDLTKEHQQDVSLAIDVIKIENQKKQEKSRNMNVYAYIQDTMNNFQDNFEYIKASCAHAQVIDKIPEKYIENRETYLELVLLHENNFPKTCSYNNYSKDRELFHLVVKKYPDNLKFFDKAFTYDPNELSFLIECNVNLFDMPKEFSQNWYLAKPFCQKRVINNLRFKYETIKSEEEALDVLSVFPHAYPKLGQFKNSEKVVKAAIDGHCREVINCLPIKNFDNKKGLHFLLMSLEKNHYMKSSDCPQLEYSRLSSFLDFTVFQELLKTLKIDKDEFKNNHIHVLSMCLDELEKEFMKKNINELPVKRGIHRKF